MKSNTKGVLKGIHSAVTVKEIQVRCLISLYFKDIYIYMYVYIYTYIYICLAQNKLPHTKVASRRYISLDSLFFKIITTPEKETE